MTASNLAFLTTLENIIGDRKSSAAGDSYTAQLFADGTQRIAQKVGEEAVELALASCQKEQTETLDEAADLVYHLLVLLANQDMKLQDVVTVLEARHKTT